MAPRPPSEDLLQSFRFRIFEVEGGPGVFENPVGGFSQTTLPEITVEMAEHRTGNRLYAKKQPSFPTIGTVSMTRGIALGDTTFFNWVIAKLFDKKPFRTDLMVAQYNQQFPGYDINEPVSRGLILRNAFPTRVKPMGDLDASSSDINLQECECAVEEVEMAPLGDGLVAVSPIP